MNRIMGVTLLILGCLSSMGQARPQHPKWPPKSYAIYYGQWDEETLRRAHQFDCIIFHPGPEFANISPEQLKRLKAGKDGVAGTSDDVLVIGYVSIGEDEKVPAGPPTLSQDEAGPTTEAGGKWVTSNKGYPGKYLDLQSYVFDAKGERQFGENGKPLMRKGKDGIPDENGVWGSYYTFAGDPGWRGEVLARLTRLQADLGVDGFFLDTVDTASPWGAYSASQPHMVQLIQSIREAFPDRFIVANRGMFLLNKFARQYASSIDGMLYESLYTVWDWHKGEGVQSPWVSGDYEVYKNQVLPAAQKYGFHLFFINYMNPLQGDFYALAAAARDLVATSKGSSYIADPLLARLFPPLSELIPLSGESREKAPTLAALSVRESGFGRFHLQFDIANLGSRVLGKDYFLDLRYGNRHVPAAQMGLLPSVPFDYPSLKLEPTPRGALRVSLDSYGLDKGQSYSFYVRGLGKSQEQDTGLLSATLLSARHGRPGAVQGLEAVGLEKSVKLTWKPNGIQRFRLYQGDSPVQLKLVGSFDKPEARVTALKNGQTYFFAVAGESKDGQEGVLSGPVVGHPEDCTPPAGPVDVKAECQSNQVTVTWTGPADGESKTYKVYCVPLGEYYRIPVRLGGEVNKWVFKDVRPGPYWVAVTSVDGSGNESRIVEKVQVVVP